MDKDYSEQDDSSTTSSSSLQIIDDDFIKSKKRTKIQKCTKKNRHKKPTLHHNTPIYKYTMKEMEKAINILNAKDSFCDNPYKFEQLYCIQNIYKYDKGITSLDSIPRLFQEALTCLEYRDWENFVRVIIKALQFPTIARSLVKNFILMEVLYDPAIKESEIAKQCLNIMFRPGITKYQDIIEKLVHIPETCVQMNEDDSDVEWMDI